MRICEYKFNLKQNGFNNDGIVASKYKKFGVILSLYHWFFYPVFLLKNFEKK